MFEQISKDLISAMKNGEKLTLSVLRMLKSALQLAKINKKDELTDEEVIAVIKSQIKMRKDSISEYEKFDKQEEIKVLEEETRILSRYLPKQLSKEEIDIEIDKAFEKINPTSMKDMGMIMRELNNLSSKADMSLVSSLVKERLQKL